MSKRQFGLKQMNKKTGETKIISTSYDQMALNADAAQMNAGQDKYSFWVVQL